MSSRIPKPPSRIPGIPVFNKKPLVENNKENVPAVAGPSKPTVEAKKAAPSKATTLKAPITKPRRSVRTVALKSASVATGRVTKVVIRKSNKFNKAPTTSTRAAIAKTVKPTTAAARAPVKRTATTTAKTETAAKVAKVMKPAPYDFKARFTQLLEKHKELKEQFSTYEEDKNRLESMKLKFIECESLLETTKASLDERTEELKTESSMRATLQSTYDELVLSQEELRQKYDHIVKEERSIRLTCNEQGDIIKQLTEERDRYKVFEEAYHKREIQCRVLNNLVQDLKGNIRVFCRVRPVKPSEEDKFEYNINYLDECTMEIRKDRESMTITGKPTDFKQEFAFDKVFSPNTTQEEVFEDLGQLVQSALDGYHICVFAYGQTGSGKTYTMQGEGGNEGMIPRSVHLLFSTIRDFEKLDWQYKVQCNFLEIYNENIKDLLNPNSSLPHDIMYNDGKGTTVTNVQTKTVRNAKELLKLLYSAQQSRATASTNSNEHSSRSHFVAKIMIEGRKDTSLYYGSINLVDLAGSESMKITKGERQEETKSINKSLSALGNVMLALHNKENHIPYRNSKLTYLLQSCLGGNSKTLMFVNIAPFDDCYNESISSLRFAAKVKEIKVSVKRNKICAK